MRKIISAALMAATLVGTLGVASSASAQEWGRPQYGWDRSWDGPRDDGYGEARREWAWRHEQERRYWHMRHDQERRYWEMRHDDRCRWDRCW